MDMHFHALRVCAEASAQAGVALHWELISRAWFAASVLEKYALAQHGVEQKIRRNGFTWLVLLLHVDPGFLLRVLLLFHWPVPKWGQRPDLDFRAASIERIWIQL